MFKVFSKILQNNELNEVELAKINDFVFCRWLSGNPNTLMLANVLNQYYDIPISLKVKFIQSIIKNKIKFIKYPKSEKMSDNSDDLLNISKYFGVSEETAKLYLEFLSKEDLDTLNKIYKIS